MHKTLSKLLIFLLILGVTPLLAGIYGILHDQITYTLSEEYYTKYKFIQFQLYYLGTNTGTLEQPEFQTSHARLGASIVGFRATWWVGLFIGISLGLVGLLHASAKDMFRITLKAIGITTGIALLTGLLGLLYGNLFLIDTVPDWNIPSHVIHKDRFIMVGSMHNFSYMGGAIGLVIAIIYSVRQKKKQK